MNDFTIFGFTISPEKYEHLLSIPQEKVFSWLEAGLNILPNLIVAIITLLLFYPFAKFAKFLTGKAYRKTAHNVAIHALAKNLVFLMVFFIGLFSALEILNLEKTVTSLLAGAGVVGLAMGLAFQEIASNFVSGVLIASRKPYGIGDIIEIQGHIGSVRSIDLRTTSLMTGPGLEVIVPNKMMITEPLINYTSTPGRRIELIVGVAYDSNLENVEFVAKNAVKDLPQLMSNLPIEFYYIAFADSSINFKLRFWVDFPGNMNFDKATHQAIINIKKAFDENGITIPYPIQTADMSLAIKQGVTSPPL